MIKVYWDFIVYLRRIREKYRMLAIANFIDEVSKFFTGNTADLLEEVLVFFRIKGGKVEAREVADTVYNKIGPVIKEIETLLNSAKDTYKLEIVERRVRDIMFFFVTLSSLSILFSGFITLYPGLIEGVSNTIFLFFESLLFLFFIISYVFITREISQIRRELKQIK
ncbi:hypothetical protein [Metallosphaera javensis (ex Hofmann et al. 2022)]|uniref:hypothetical protein n=1 Tax=Metallosphaera javensis (ex Hofmann et al. 2022) TaxID=99938 RepID=UPI001EDECE66|nr:hypothetical protein [Metallosphaera javensis (ex Hofmann et al. 2022)]